VLYFLHERMWLKLPLGKIRSAVLSRIRKWFFTFYCKK